MATSNDLRGEMKLEIAELDNWMDWNPPTAFFETIECLESSDESMSEDSEQVWNDLSGKSITDAKFDLAEHVLLIDAPFDWDDKSSPILTSAPTADLPLEPADTLGQKDERRGLYGIDPSLSEAEVLDLLSIAMPSAQVPAELTVKGVKPDSLMQSTKQKTAGGNVRGSKIQKKSHNVIEKRYRNNLNGKIVALQQSVPGLNEIIQPGEDALNGQGDASPKHGKADIITRATDYISYLESSTGRLSGEVVILEAQLLVCKKQLTRMGVMMMKDGASPLPIVESLETIQEDFVQIGARRKTTVKSRMLRSTRDGSGMNRS